MLYSKAEWFARRQAVRRFGYWISLLLLGGGLVWSFRGVDIQWSDVSPWAGLAGLLSGFAALWLGAERFRAMADSLGVSISRLASLSVVVNGGIANLLPMPGNLIVRWLVLAKHAGPRNSALVNLAITLLWAGISFGMAGLGFDRLGYEYLSVAGYASGSVFTLLSLLIHLSVATRRVAILIGLAQQILISFLYVLRIWVLGLFLGLDISLAFSAVIAISALAGSATGFLPSGMGAVEFLGAFLAVLVDSVPEEAFLILAASRLVTMVSLLLFFAFLRGKGSAA